MFIFSKLYAKKYLQYFFSSVIPQIVPKPQDFTDSQTSHHYSYILAAGCHYGISRFLHIFLQIA